MSGRRLFIPGYFAGFTNSRISLELAVGLAHLTGRILAPYRFRVPLRASAPLRAEQFEKPLALIPDLFEIPVPWSNEYLEERRLPEPDALTCEWAEDLCDSLFYLNADDLPDDEFCRAFRNGRSHAYRFDRRQNDAADLHIKGEILGYYCHFFYLNDRQRQEVIALMKRLQPKREYREFADRIACSFGRFNAIHLRRGDFVSTRFTPRAAHITGDEIVANLASRMDPDIPLIICTDGSPQEKIFGPIRSHFRKTLFLDSYLEEESRFRKELANLPVNDQIVRALVSQLVASQAEVFAGTLYSTFTALIHRQRGFAARTPNFLYCYSDFDSASVPFDECEFLPVGEGPFSWNRTRYPVPPCMYSWLREWPESFDPTL